MGLASGSLMGLATLTLGWLGYTATQQPGTPVQAPSLDKRVTASLTNASIDEVLQWLRRTGVNFVIEKTQTSADTKLNINVVDKPLKDVMDAIASAVGGKWQKHGDVYSLNRRGMTPPPDMGRWEQHLAPMIDAPVGEFNFQLPPGFDEHFAEIGPRIREHMDNLELELGDMQKFDGLAPEGMHFRILTQEQRNELFGSLTPKQKELMKSRGHLVPEDLTPRQREILGDVRGSLRLKDGDREFNFKGPKGDRNAEVIIAPPGAPMPGQVAPPRPAPHIEGVPMPAPPRVEGVPMPAPPVPEISRWKELWASLTTEQKGLLNSQGHLFDDQLTHGQRRLVNLPDDATYTLTIVNGDNSITIKSRKQ